MPRSNTTNPATPTKGRAARERPLSPFWSADAPDTRVYLGDCRDVLAGLPEVRNRHLDLVFADPPFNWKRKYEEWNDKLPEQEYLDFTHDWLTLCASGLRPGGALWVNIPDDWAADIVVHLKRTLGLTMINWCIWHYRFGQNTLKRFINSKVHALYFTNDPDRRTWNPDEIYETSDRASTYFDPRTHAKKAGKSGLRVPMDVWYGKYFGRIQGNNAERRHNHDNQIPEVYLERVVRACSDPGDLVLDPFLGSGTTCTVARALKRRSIGIEYSKATAESAAERIDAGPVRIDPDKPTLHTSAIFEPRRTAAPAPGRAHARHATTPDPQSDLS